MRYAAGLALSLMLIPIGYYLVIEGRDFQAQVGGCLSIVSGLILFIVVWFKGTQAERLERQKNDDKFEAALREIKGLRQDMNNILREGRNERKGKPKQ